MSQQMIGCSVDGSINPVVTGTKGIADTAQRIGPGHVRLKIDYPLAPSMYAARACITEAIASTSVICKKNLDLTGALATVDVMTYVAGVPTDLDFDLSLFVFNRTQ